MEMIYLVIIGLALCIGLAIAFGLIAGTIYLLAIPEMCKSYLKENYPTLCKKR